MQDVPIQQPLQDQEEGPDAACGDDPSLLGQAACNPGVPSSHGQAEGPDAALIVEADRSSPHGPKAVGSTDSQVAPHDQEEGPDAPGIADQDVASPPFALPPVGNADQDTFSAASGQGSDAPGIADQDDASAHGQDQGPHAPGTAHQDVAGRAEGPHAPGSAEDVPPCSSDAVLRVQGEQLELSDSNVRAMQHRLLQEIQSAWPWLGIPVTPKPEVNAHGHDSDLEDLLPLTSLVQAQAVEHHPLEPVHQSYRVMLYRPSKLRPQGVIAIRERSGFRSQVGSASIPPGVTIEEAQDIAGRFVEALEAGQILDSDLTELLRDTLLWVAAGQ